MRMSPARSIRNPEPVETLLCCWGNRSNGILDLLDDVGAHEHDAGRVADVDVVRRQPSGSRTLGEPDDGRLLDRSSACRGAR